MSDIGISGGVTLDLISRALDAASLRETVYANNIANANVPGYQPESVSFEDQLGALRQEALGRTDDADTERQLQDVEPRVESSGQSQGANGDKVQIDFQVSSMMQNAVWYQSLLAGYDKADTILRLAIRGA